MPLTPRYDGPEVMRIEVPIDDPSIPLLRQRRRLAETLRGLDAAAWAAPSRCEGWTTQDVVNHLVGTNQFWAISIAAGRAGTPSRYLESFDPVDTPAQMVEPLRALPPESVLANYEASVDALEEAVAGLDADGWSTRAEAPPGHLAITAVVLHALWDAWIHERDIAIPLGLALVRERDEIVDSLVYAAAIGPTLLACGGSTRAGALVVEAVDPDVRVVVEAGTGVVVHDGERPAGAVHVSGRAEDLIEALTCRAPMPCAIATDDLWLLSGLARAFRQA